METKQTAVEWLFNRLSMHLNIHQKAEAFEQAKQMEKEQIIDAYLSKRRKGSFLTAIQTIDQAEHYYTKTYCNEQKTN